MTGTRAILGALLLLLGCGSDAGDDWGRVSSTPSVTSFVDLWVFADDDIWLLDGSSTVHRYDGEAFTTLDTPSTGGLGCIFALSPTQVWLCAGTEVLFYDGANFSATDVTAARGLDSLSGLWASSPTDVWAIGDDAIVAHYDGQAWTGTIVGSPFPSSIWGSGPSDVYVLGTFDFMHYDGSVWTEIDLDSGGGDGQVWGTSADDVWVMTESYELSHYDGSQWETIPTDDFVGDLAAVWGPAPDDLWAVGSAGSIARYTGGSWEELAHQKIGSPYLRMFTRVHGSSSTNVWAIGYQLGEGGSTPLLYRYAP